MCPSLQTYRRHDHLALESSSYAVVDTLGLPPARIDAHVGVTLMSVEALRACKINTSASKQCII
jgi:hypothetical protein